MTDSSDEMCGEGEDPTALIWPRPQATQLLEGELDLTRGLRVESVIGDTLSAALQEQGRWSETGVPVRAALEGSVGESSQAYRIEIQPTEVRLTAVSEVGLFHATHTFLQLLENERLEPRTRLRCLTVDDWPSVERRGVMLDVSRDRVPRMDFLFEWVRRLATLKVNELQLYTEHTFAFRGHESVWRDASPFTPAEIRALDQHCRSVHIELVPNQQSFGHMHRWLKLPQYRHLAEFPEGIEHPFSFDKEPYGLCATDPASLEFLAGLYDDLLPNFSSNEFNVGLDEALDLGVGRSRSRCEALGRGHVFAEYTNSVHDLIRERGKRMQFWADEVENNSALTRQLPADAIGMLWGYEAGHPFEEKAACLERTGLEFRICPGTSSWQSLSGRTNNALANLRSAAKVANSSRATGITICDWGDRGHLQPPPVSALGVAIGAGLAWNEAGTGPLDHSTVSGVLNRRVFRDPSGILGALFHDLGTVHEPAGGTVQNGTALFFLLLFAHASHPHERTMGLDRDGLRECMARIETLQGRLGATRSQRPDAQLLVAEADWILRTLATAARLGEGRMACPDRPTGELPKRLRHDLSSRLREILELQRVLWLRRSREGGLSDSLRQLGRTVAALESKNSL